MTTLEKIEKICADFNESAKSAADALNKIMTAIAETKRPDFSKIKDGQKFIYRGIEWVRLGKEQGGILCIVTKAYKVTKFDTNNCNDWRKSSLRKLLNKDFLALLNPDDLLDYESDLIADNGDTRYGKCADKVGLLSCDLFRKYREIVPSFPDWMWTCTPWYINNAGDGSGVRHVGPDGSLYYIYAYTGYAAAPACIFKES